MEFVDKATPLSTGGFDQASSDLGIEAAKLLAVFDIESKKCGFLDDRRPVILFERHKFDERTKGKYRVTHPDLSIPHAGGYGKGGAAQYDRLARACTLDRSAALWSTSWGLGQIMGFNFKAAGFASPEDLVDQMCASEDAQLAGMVNFLLTNGLHKPLQTGNWTSFARGYNGERYYINKYDDRLRGAYNKYATGPLPDLSVRAAQLWLTFLGFHPGPVDGWFGSNTLLALNAYRSGADHPESDHLSQSDLDNLEASVEAH